MVIYAFRRSTPIQAFSPRRAGAGFRQCLYRFDAELLAAARTHRVHDQQYQIGVTDLLDAEGSAVTEQARSFNGFLVRLARNEKSRNGKTLLRDGSFSSLFEGSAIPPGQGKKTAKEKDEIEIILTSDCPIFNDFERKQKKNPPR